MQTNRPKKEKGTALIIVMVTFIASFGFSVASLNISHASLKNAQYNAAKTKANYAAISSFEDTIAELKKRSITGIGDFSVMDAIKNATGVIDLDGVLAGNLDYGQELASNEKVFTSEGKIIGFVTTALGITKANKFERVYTIKTTSRVTKGTKDIAKTEIEAKVHFGVANPSSFHFSYFMNHFGWMAANKDWQFNGNMGAAGVFDWFGSPLTVRGTAQFGDFDEATGSLVDPIIANSTGAPIEGGTISGFEVKNGQNLKGGPNEEYPDQSHPGIPLLTTAHFDTVREAAYDNNSTIKIGNNIISDGVYGDKQGPADAGSLVALTSAGYNPATEHSTGNLFLEGSGNEPIELNGTVVVEGNLFIKGRVTGQGSLHVRGNVYIGGDVQYKNPTSNPQSATDKDKIEKWISINKNKDMLGIFTKGSIGLGAYSTYTTYSGVKSWIEYEPANESAEKKNGFDGMPSTNDFGEGGADANVWNVQRYTAEDAAEGRMPAGFSIGDAVPGTGEDFDGDGKEDPRLTVQEFKPRDGADMESVNTNFEKLTTQYWGGNPPGGSKTLKNYTSKRTDRLDAVLFTNKLFTSYVSVGRLIWNGSIIGRLEGAILGGNWTFNFDRRIMAVSELSNSFELPVVLKEIEVRDYQIH